MGHGYTAHCTCGFSGSVSVGSTRAMHNKEHWFPHRCNKCKTLVQVDMLSKNWFCPDCKSKDISTCEPPTWRVKESIGHWLGTTWRKRLWLHMRDDEIESSYCWRLKKDFILMRQGNVCPQCQLQNMSYHYSCSYD